MNLRILDLAEADLFCCEDSDFMSGNRHALAGIFWTAYTPRLSPCFFMREFIGNIWATFECYLAVFRMRSITASRVRKFKCGESWTADAIQGGFGGNSPGVDEQ